MDVRNFEKYITGSAYAITVLAIVYKYLITNTASVDMVYYSITLGGIFLGRKVASYMKKDSYYQNSIDDGVVLVPPIPSPTQTEQTQTIQTQSTQNN